MSKKDSKTAWAKLPEATVTKLDEDLVAAYRTFSNIVAQQPVDAEFFVAAVRLHVAIEHTLLEIDYLKKILDASKPD